MPGHSVPHAFNARLRQLLPRKSGAHRTACLTLYRALLEQCPRIPIPNDLPPAGLINPIRHLIRKRFKRDVSISSPRLAVSALKVGYAVEQLLRTAGDGNALALSHIHTLLRLQQERSEASRQICNLRPSREPPTRVGPYPGAPKLLDIRPLPAEKLSGLRRVPHLTQTNGYPFLRTRKPSSPYLARVLRDKIRLKDKRFKSLETFEIAIEDGSNEAMWEEIVREQLEKGREGKKSWVKVQGADWGNGDESWIAESINAKARVKKLLWEDLMRASDLGKKMAAVAKQEHHLWRQERGGRNHKKKIERKERSQTNVATQGVAAQEEGKTEH